MRGFLALCGTVVSILVIGTIAWLLGLDDLVRHSLTTGHLLDWGMGALCLLWLLIVLTVPWNLYFQAHEVAFELQRSREREVQVPREREAYIARLRKRLGWLAVGLHLFSAALIAVLATLAGRSIGYYFAVFYLISTGFRPILAGYVYLRRKLKAIHEEVRYPREDVVELRQRLQTLEFSVRDLTNQISVAQKEAQQEIWIREAETRDLRQSVHAIGREFETTVSRLTDNQEVIRGIQAFVRLIAQSTSPVNP